MLKLLRKHAAALGHTVNWLNCVYLMAFILACQEGIEGCISLPRRDVVRKLVSQRHLEATAQVIRPHVTSSPAQFSWQSGV